jgi:ferric-dicitrate binding protein FerR (iron transport regulator)
MIVKRNRWRLSAAAIILLLVGSAYLLFFRPAHRLADGITTVTSVPIHDIGPGGNKAILTLGDGSRIVLDSAGNGTLARQGGVNVIKLDSGKLAYSISHDVKPGKASFNIITTPRGGQYQVILPDGTKVWLNAASSLRYPVSFARLKLREVRLTGEGYFEVARNSKMPFIVSTNTQDIEVLGTTFNVMAYSDEATVKTTLLNGLIKVSTNNSHTLLKPGEQSILENNGLFKITNDADVTEAISWKNGLTTFKDEDIKGIMRKISRWYDVDVVYKGDIPERIFMGGIPRNANLSELLNVLEESKIHFEVEGKKVVVIP